jgi:hypothetical protein
MKIQIKVPVPPRPVTRARTMMPVLSLGLGDLIWVGGILSN